MFTCYNFVNLLISNLPIILLFSLVYIPNDAGNFAADSSTLGNHYMGDSLNSVIYKLTPHQKSVFDHMWMNKTGEILLSAYLATTQVNVTTGHSIICGIRWNYKGSEIGGYCYDGSVKMDYASPVSSDFVASSTFSKHSDVRSDRVRVILSTILSVTPVRYELHYDGVTYAAIPIGRTGLLENNELNPAEHEQSVQCMIAGKVVEQTVAGWAGFDSSLREEIDGMSVARARSAIRVRIHDGGSTHNYGSFFIRTSSYSGIAAYCDQLHNEKLLVGWAGLYAKNHFKTAGFIWRYWPLLLQYLVLMTVSGDAFGRSMFKGYDAFLYTGLSRSVAVQLLVFNERLYHTLFNFYASIDFEDQKDNVQIELLVAAAVFMIFQFFISSSHSKSAMGLYFTHFEGCIRWLVFVCTLSALVLGIFQSYNTEETGISRDCEVSYSKCFYPYNSLYIYLWIQAASYLFNHVVVMLYYLFTRTPELVRRNTSIAPNAAQANVSFKKRTDDSFPSLRRLGPHPITSFEHYCLIGAVPRHSFHRSAYVVQDGTVSMHTEYVRLCGFIYIKKIGLIRTKDLIFLYCCRWIPLRLRSRSAISFMIWLTKEEKDSITISEIVRVYWDEVLASQPIQALDINIR